MAAEQRRRPTGRHVPELGGTVSRHPGDSVGVGRERQLPDLSGGPRHHRYQAPVVHVEYPHGAVGAGGGDQPSVEGKRDPVHGSLVSLKPSDFCAVVEPPQPRDAVLARGRHQTAIGREGGTERPPWMLEGWAHRGGIGEAPDPRRPILGGRGDEPAILRKVDGIHPPVVRLEPIAAIKGCWIPEVNGAVVTAAGDRAAVGGKPHIVDPPHALAEHASLAERGGVPEHDGGVGKRRRHQLLIGRARHGEHLVGRPHHRRDREIGVPYPCRTVSRSRPDPGRAGDCLDRPDGRRVTAKPGHLDSVGRIPQAEHAVARRRGDAVAGTEVGHAVDSKRVLEHPSLDPPVEIPDPHRAVVASRRQFAAAGVEGEAEDTARVPIQPGHGGACRRIPEPDGLVLRHRRHEAVIG